MSGADLDYVWLVNKGAGLLVVPYAGELSSCELSSCRTSLGLVFEDGSCRTLANLPASCRATLAEQSILLATVDPAGRVLAEFEIGPQA